jgi:hypothetical protein
LVAEDRCSQYSRQEDIDFSDRCEDPTLHCSTENVATPHLNRDFQIEITRELAKKRAGADHDEIMRAKRKLSTDPKEREDQ